MRSRRSRIVLTTLSALVALGLVVIALPDSDAPRSEVATEDPTPDRTTTTRDQGDTPAPGLPPGVDVDDELVVTAPTTSTLAADTTTATTGSSPTTSGLAPSTSSTTATPTQTTTPTPTPITEPTRPHDLLGRVVFHREAPWVSQVWSMESDGRSLREELDCDNPGSSLDLSPDGRELLRQCRVDAYGFGTYQLRAIRVDGDGSRPITPPYPAGGITGQPRFAPDGEHVVAAVSYWAMPATTAGGLVLFDLTDGTNRVLVPEILPLDMSWSPDGTALAFVHQSTLVRLNVGTGEQQILYTGRAVESLAWSPDGTRLAVTGQKSVGSWDGWSVWNSLYLYDLTEGEVVDIATSLEGWAARYPIWVADDRLVFERKQALWSVSVAGSAPAADRPVDLILDGIEAYSVTGR